MAQAKRSVRLYVQLTRDESKRLRKVAHEKETTMSEFVRSRLPTSVTMGTVVSKVRA